MKMQTFKIKNYTGLDIAEERSVNLKAQQSKYSE